eukprot:UN28534
MCYYLLPCFTTRLIYYFYVHSYGSIQMWENVRHERQHFRSVFLTQRTYSCARHFRNSGFSFCTLLAQRYYYILYRFMKFIHRQLCTVRYQKKQTPVPFFQSLFYFRVCFSFQPM